MRTADLLLSAAFLAFVLTVFSVGIMLLGLAAPILLIARCRDAARSIHARLRRLAPADSGSSRRSL